MADDSWVTQQDPDTGAEYYYNVKTGDSSWTWPPEGVGAAGGYTGEAFDEEPYGPTSNASIGRGPRGKNGFGPKWLRAMNKVRAAVSLKRKFLVPVWEKHVDDESGRDYYYNTVTLKSQWERPKVFHQSPPASPTGKKQKGFGFADPTSVLRLKADQKEDDEGMKKRIAAFEGMINAAKVGNLNVILAALEPSTGVGPNDTTAKGATVLNVAAEAGHEAIVEYLLLNTEADINSRDNRRYTPLHSACNRGHLRVVHMLLYGGADFSLRNFYDMTPYDIAKYRGYASICTLFEKSEVDTTELYVDRKWFKFDLHNVRHGQIHHVKVDDSHFYIKTQFASKLVGEDRHDNLHHS